MRLEWVLFFLQKCTDTVPADASRRVCRGVKTRRKRLLVDQGCSVMEQAFVYAAAARRMYVLCIYFHNGYGRYM
jgi:hypothetical protein